MSIHDFESYQKQARDRLLDVISRINLKQKKSGLTEEVLEALLPDEN